ncbi:hypothetical protein [Nostoc favosum]|uniref:Uncharacterized protein n=1 Tax=Nostoc favosum CHAB5714 TaxID=2780399 RepID=A0ABS8I5G3_9NOSO|nr:hypothetical protein [Nostoc favosum]MCC5599355.1 hypothetical protein [Nostoc favosum CHAB5714]
MRFTRTGSQGDEGELEVEAFAQTLIHPPQILIHPPQILIHPPQILIHPPQILIPNAQYFSTRGCALSVAMPQALRLPSLRDATRTTALRASRSVQVPYAPCPTFSYEMSEIDDYVRDDINAIALLLLRGLD